MTQAKKAKKVDVPRGLMLHAAHRARLAFDMWIFGDKYPPPWLDDPRLAHVPSKLFCDVAERLADEGLLAFGVNLNRPWLTANGYAALMGYS